MGNSRILKAESNASPSALIYKYLSEHENKLMIDKKSIIKFIILLGIIEGAFVTFRYTSFSNKAKQI